MLDSPPQPAPLASHRVLAHGCVEVPLAMITFFPPALSDRIAEAIRHETHNRVRDLDIEQDGPDLIVRGRAASYYVKQLAHRAALELLESGRLFNEIQVGPPARRLGAHLHSVAGAPHFLRASQSTQTGGRTAAPTLAGAVAASM